MATEPINIPIELFTRAKEAAEREEISIEELVAEAIEKRVQGEGKFARFYDMAERRGTATPDDVEREIAARRAERVR